VNIEVKLKFNVLTFLLALNLVIFLLAFWLDGSIGFNTELFYLFGGQVTSQIRLGDLWLLVTPNFFHIGIIHFVFNAISLFRIGQLVDFFYDGRKLFITYILGGIGGVGLSYFVSILLNSSTLSLGASASIFALIGLLLGGTIRRNRYGRDLPFNTKDLLPFVIVAFVFGFIPGLNINNWAHLGGLITGVILGVLMPNSISRNENKFENKIWNGVFIISLIIFILSYASLILTAYNFITK
jgi:rhomboid protease GluP